MSSLDRLVRKHSEKFPYKIKLKTARLGLVVAWCLEELGEDALTSLGDVNCSYECNPKSRWTFLGVLEDQATFYFIQEKDALMFKLRWHGAVE